MSRGGARKGAGRKKSEDHRTYISLRVDDDTRRRMAYLRERGLKISREFELWIEQRFDLQTALERLEE